ncbi:hypothetical protein [Paraburkholderia caballeronis]|uniref:Meckel syndrome type 1 protein n=1 Tax=Paraburkholderia caballeronis TaxID=416943 RepID=A0A1H7L0L6_9BURK|nr:hypothetical protein [Paraburkholderia caballeronis]PXW28245.1 hypothetical protein C7403_102137 [Paraburkholderia caballeronis]PXX03611.1 hypothetical protein C7407_102137 [Paraburkholderia caballeronis]RAK04355.1 hypothetical protein C7409_102137 [Paraburkholderia caballeronis]SED83520.1 Meckel syndrome type 1 protein [Paraburkholderia caballeronis]SEK92589.1 Meckel syndrome type 1 protein [Paraburkholderia caballeronis]
MKSSNLLKLILAALAPLYMSDDASAAAPADAGNAPTASPALGETRGGGMQASEPQTQAQQGESAAAATGEQEAGGATVGEIDAAPAAAVPSDTSATTSAADAALRATQVDGDPQQPAVDDPAEAVKNTDGTPAAAPESGEAQAGPAADAAASTGLPDIAASNAVAPAPAAAAAPPADEVIGLTLPQRVAMHLEAVFQLVSDHVSAAAREPEAEISAVKASIERIEAHVRNGLEVAHHEVVSELAKLRKLL